MDTSNLYNHGVALFDTKYRYLQWFIYSACILTGGLVIQLFSCSPEHEAGDMRTRQRRSIQEPAYELMKNYRYFVNWYY
jgi:hypothetical protein